MTAILSWINKSIPWFSWCSCLLNSLFHFIRPIHHSCHQLFLVLPGLHHFCSDHFQAHLYNQELAMSEDQSWGLVHPDTNHTCGCKECPGRLLHLSRSCLLLLDVELSLLSLTVAKVSVHSEDLRDENNLPVPVVPQQHLHPGSVSWKCL